MPEKNDFDKHYSENKLLDYYNNKLTGIEKDKITFHLLICDECRELYEDVMFEQEPDNLSKKDSESSYVKDTMNNFANQFINKDSNNKKPKPIVKLMNTYVISSYSSTPKKTYPIIKLYNYKFDKFYLDIIQTDKEAYKLKIKSKINLEKYIFVITDEDENELMFIEGRKKKIATIEYNKKLLNKKLNIKVYIKIQ